MTEQFTLTFSTRNGWRSCD